MTTEEALHYLAQIIDTLEHQLYTRAEIAREALAVLRDELEWHNEKKPQLFEDVFFSDGEKVYIGYWNGDEWRSQRQEPHGNIKCWKEFPNLLTKKKGR
jgi:hypothetical protein